MTLERCDNPVDDPFRRQIAAFNVQIGQSVIRTTLDEEIFQRAIRIVASKQWPSFVASQPCDQDGYWYVEPYREAFIEKASARHFIRKGAAASGNYSWRRLQEPKDRLPFVPPKGVFSMTFENFGDAHAGVALDLRVRIGEGSTEPFRQSTSDD